MERWNMLSEEVGGLSLGEFKLKRKHQVFIILIRVTQIVASILPCVLG